MDASRHGAPSCGAGWLQEGEHRLAEPSRHDLWKGRTLRDKIKAPSHSTRRTRAAASRRTLCTARRARGMSVRTVQRVVRAIANRAQINRKVTPHVLCHTFSVTAVQKGISLPALQRCSGTRDLSQPLTRARYTRVQREMVRRAKGCASRISRATTMMLKASCR